MALIGVLAILEDVQVMNDIKVMEGNSNFGQMVNDSNDLQLVHHVLSSLINYFHRFFEAHNLEKLDLSEYVLTATYLKNLMVFESKEVYLALKNYNAKVHLFRVLIDHELQEKGI